MSMQTRLQSIAWPFVTTSLYSLHEPNCQLYADCCSLILDFSITRAVHLQIKLRAFQLLCLVSLRLLQALQLFYNLFQACSLLSIFPQHIVHLLPQGFQGCVSQPYGPACLVPVLLCFFQLLALTSERRLYLICCLFSLSKLFLHLQPFKNLLLTHITHKAMMLVKQQATLLVIIASSSDCQSSRASNRLAASNQSLGIIWGCILQVQPLSKHKGINANMYKLVAWRSSGHCTAVTNFK